MICFDANVTLGRWPGEPFAFTDVAELLANLQKLGIARALVSHTIAWMNSPVLGNQMLMEALAGHPELEPCWILTPGPQIDAQGGVSAVCEQLENNRVRAVRLCPRDHVFSLAGQPAQQLLTELNRRRYLVLIDLDQVFTQSGLYDYSAESLNVLEQVCKRFPDLSILLTRIGYRAYQILFPMLEAYPNLFLDLSFFATHQGVEEVAEKLGARRLVFGTGQPLGEPGGALLRLQRAMLPQDDLRRIASANLEGLLARVRLRRGPAVEGLGQPQAAPIEPVDPLDALPEQVEITDAHVHLGDYYKFYIPRNSADEMIRVMDHLKISSSCMSSHLAITADWQAGNRITERAVRAHPTRLTGQVVVSPNEPGLARDELTRAFDEWGFKAIKLVPDNHQQPIGCKGYQPVFEFAAQRRCLVLVHTYHGSLFDDPRLFGELAGRYPEVPIMLVHSGALPAAFKNAIHLAQEHPNLYLDISGSFITSYWIRRLVAEVGASRVVYSSDQPFIDPRYTLGKLLYAGLSINELAMVIGGNARRLHHYPVSV